MVFSISHAPFLLVLRIRPAAVAGARAACSILVVLTELNDVSQYIWGKRSGGHKIMPTVSPNKTWEGLLGGIVHHGGARGGCWRRSSRR